MSFTMADFRREFMKEHLPELPPKEQAEVLQKVAAEIRMAGLPAEQVRDYLHKLEAGGKPRSRKTRRKK